MSTCTEDIAHILNGNLLPTVPLLEPNSPFTFQFSTGNNFLFRFNASSSVIADFTLVLKWVSSVVPNMRVNVTIYQYSGTTFSSIGGVTTSDLITNFQNEFLTGTYLICVSTPTFNTTLEGTLSVTIQGFVPQHNLIVTFSDGGTLLADLTAGKPPEPVPCEDDLLYEIIEGNLPTGLEMLSTGRIRGWLPNLDCIDETEKMSPSQNWYYENLDGIADPWGFQWRFKVRVSMPSNPADNFDERWFCIRIHNNWDFDRDAFLQKVPFTKVQNIRVIEKAKNDLPKTCFLPCEEEVIREFVPQPLKDTCPQCSSSDLETDITLIEIPVELKHIEPSAFVIWWNENRNKIFDCAAINNFIRQLNDSPLFQSLLMQSGVLDEKRTQDEINREVITASDFQNFLQISASRLINGRNTTDLDTRMKEWQQQENQKLPITAIGHTGEMFTATFDITKKVWTP